MHGARGLTPQPTELARQTITDIFYGALIFIILILSIICLSQSSI